MKRFRDYIKEIFVTADNIRPHHMTNARKYTEIFENPTAKELSDVYKASDYAKDEARGVIDKKGNLYVWTNDVLHKQGIDLLYDSGIKLDINSITHTYKDGISIHIKNNVVYLSEMFNKLRATQNKKLIDSIYAKAKKKTPYLEFVAMSIMNALDMSGYSKVT